MPLNKTRTQYQRRWTAYVPPPQRGDDVDVEEAAAGEGDVEETDPSPGFFGDEGGDFQMRFLALEENKLE